MKCTECKVGYCAYRSTEPQRECPIQNGHRYSSHFSMPPQESGKGSIVPEGTHMVIDWSSFRREAAKEILAGMVANKVYRAHPDDNDEDELKAQQRAAKRAAFTAIVYADALIEKFKQE